MIVLYHENVLLLS